MPDDIVENTKNTLVSEPVRESHTYLDDWTWLLGIQGLPARVLQYYVVVRAFIFEKSGRTTVELDDDEIAHFMGCSRHSVHRARKDAESWGLVTVLEERQRTGYTRGIRHQLPVSRTIRVHLDPPESVITNCYVELRRYRAAREAARGAGQNGCSNLHDRSDQGKDDHEGVSAGQNGCSNLHDRRADLHDRRADLHDRRADLHEDTGGDQGEGGSQVSSQVSEQHQSSRPAADAADDDGSSNPEKRQDEQEPEQSSASKPSSGEHHETAGGKGEKHASALAEQARALLENLRMPRGPRVRAYPAAIDAVADQLAAGHSKDLIVAALTADIEGYTKPAAGVGDNIKKLSALIAEIGAQIGSQGPESAMREWCGQCEADDFRFAVRDDGRMVRCPDCNPTSAQSAA